MKTSMLVRPALLRKGFSIVELLIVILIIGLIASIVLPDVGPVNERAKKATSQRNAQTLASMQSSAAAVGINFRDRGYTSKAQVIDALAIGITPTSGNFTDRVFIVPNIPGVTDYDRIEERAEIEKHLSWDENTNSLEYHPDGDQPSE